MGVEKKAILVYDICVLPKFGMDINDGQLMINMYEHSGIILWDSSKATKDVDCEPFVYHVDDNSPIKIIDTQTEKGTELMSKLKGEK